MSGLIKLTFDHLKSNNKKAIVPFLTADFPNRDIFLEMLYELPNKGSNIIEIGIPFSDPMADGEVIQKASLQSIKNGFRLTQLLHDISAFKQSFPKIPIVLMSYINPIFSFGMREFVATAEASLVDGLLLVDLPPEQHNSLVYFDASVDFIRLVTQTTDIDRLPLILKNSSGFIYYVSVKGITGTQQPNIDVVSNHLDFIRTKISLPLLIGFGISTPKIALEMASISDGIIIGSSILKPFLNSNQTEYPQIKTKQLEFIDTVAGVINGSD